MMDSSKTSMHLEVCYNKSMFLPITNVTSSLEVDIVSNWVNCSLHRMEGYRFHFNSKTNVSMRCRVDDHYFNTSVTSRCVLPNISVPLGICSVYRYQNSTHLSLSLSLSPSLSLSLSLNLYVDLILLYFIFCIFSSSRDKTQNSGRLAWVLSRNILPRQCRSIQMEGYALGFQEYNFDPKTDLLDA